MANCRSLGSRVSLSQSPKRFRDITVNRTARPGIVEIHQAPASRSRPSATMEPQAGVGGGTPAPKKLSVASIRINTNDAFRWESIVKRFYIRHVIMKVNTIGHPFYL